ncbi:hypothetical protein BJY04DRAFT_213671 [Aspergillus karnatakaensis]|uniref:uncharacterized protein n=1 Tax=Aspergillus karnatakaensis TaxID=1810916 RepID=UPI003CCE2F2A
MYDTTLTLDVSYLNTPFPRHYESDEEDISEPESHSSPFDTHRRSATLDSIMSTGESSNGDVTESVDRPSYPRLLSPFPSTGKSSRPVSMDTVKRSSVATFGTDSCTIFDHDDDMIIELPSPDSTTPLPSPLFLQPTVYVPSEPFTPFRNSFNSSSSASIYSDDESDVFVAEQVTYVEPLVKPNLILISPTSEGTSSSPREPASPSSSEGSVYSNHEATKSQPLLGETSMDRGRSRYPVRPTHTKMPGSLSALDTLNFAGPPRDIYNAEPMSAPAVEAPQSMSFRARSMSFSRPQTPAAENRRRLRKEPPLRPPSAASTATFSLFPSAQSSNYQEEDFRSRSTSISHSAASSEYSLSSSQPPSRTASPSPYCNPAYNRSRSGSLYSVSSMSTPTTTKRPPLPYRGSMIKGSGMLSGYSSSSLRAELDNGHELAEQAGESDAMSVKSKKSRKKSLKHLKSSSKSESSESSAKSFVGFMLRGKRKSFINKNF